MFCGGIGRFEHVLYLVTPCLPALSLTERSFPIQVWEILHKINLIPDLIHGEFREKLMVPENMS